MHPFTIAAASLMAATVSMGGCETGPKSEPETIAKVGLPVPKPDPARTEYSTLFDLCKSGEATPERVQEFLDLGADVKATESDRIGVTPLVAAARFSKNPEVVTLLIKAGADVNTKSEDGVTALYMAAFGNENPEVLTVLIEAGADVNAKDNNGETPLHAAAASFYENLKILTLLIQAGADVNAKDNNGETPLDLAEAAVYKPKNAEILRAAGGKSGKDLP